MSWSYEEKPTLLRVDPRRALKRAALGPFLIICGRDVLDDAFEIADPRPREFLPGDDFVNHLRRCEIGAVRTATHLQTGRRHVGRNGRLCIGNERRVHSHKADGRFIGDGSGKRWRCQRAKGLRFTRLPDVVNHPATDCEDEDIAKGGTHSVTVQFMVMVSPFWATVPTAGKSDSRNRSEPAAARELHMTTLAMATDDEPV